MVKSKKFISLFMTIAMIVSMIGIFAISQNDVQAASKTSRAKTVKSNLSGKCDKNMICVIIGAMEYESNINPTASSHDGSCYGSLQWTGNMLKKLKKRSNYKTLKTQTKFTYDTANSNGAVKKGGSIESDAKLFVKKYVRPAYQKAAINTITNYAKYWKKKLY